MEMDLIKTILVDDEPRGINSLQKLLELNCPDVRIIATSSSADEAIEQINTLKPNLVFLDIAMPAKSGLELLKEMKDFPFEIIFVTAHNKFMIEAFHFSAIDYLLKPVDDELLIDAVKRARKRIQEKSGSKPLETLLHNFREKKDARQMKLCIPSLKGFQVVQLEAILYAEASGNYTNFLFNNLPSICSSKPIHEYEEVLSDAGFLRIHKSFLINLVHVKEYLRGEGGTVILSNGMEIEVSRRKKDVFLSRMKDIYKF